jgi:hypothetical protein
VFFPFFSVISQNYVDILNTNAGYIPSVGFEENDEAHPMQIQALTLLAPVPINDSLALLFGFNYVGNSVHLGNSQKSFQMLAPRLGIHYKHNSKWSSNHFVHTKFSSDIISTQQRSVQYGFLSQFRYNFHKHKSMKFGLYLNKDVFGWFTTPIFSFYYRSPNKKFEADLIIPIYSRADYKFTKWTRIGADIFTAVRSYELLEDVFANQYVHNAFNEISAYLQIDLLKEQLLIKIKGVYAYHDFLLYNDDETVPLGITGNYLSDNRIQQNPTHAAGWGIRLALTYRYNLD